MFFLPKNKSKSLRLEFLRDFMLSLSFPKSSSLFYTKNTVSVLGTTSYINLLVHPTTGRKGLKITINTPFLRIFVLVSNVYDLYYLLTLNNSVFKPFTSQPDPSSFQILLPQICFNSDLIQISYHPAQTGSFPADLLGSELDFLAVLFSSLFNSSSSLLPSLLSFQSDLR